MGVAMNSYYVMHCIDGDECLLHHRDNLHDALAVARQEIADRPRADISVWSTVPPRIVAVTDRNQLREVTYGR